MEKDKNVMDMTDHELIENYNLFGINPLIAPEEKLPKDGSPLFVYKKCSILKDTGVQYSNYTYISQGRE